MDAKHQFKYTYKEGCDDFSPIEVTFDIPGDVTISQMLYNFESYLKACGFIFDGHLEIVDETLENIDTADEVYGCMADFDKEDTIHPSDSDGWCNDDCGCETTSSPLETSEFNKQFDVTKTTASSKDSISVEDYQKRRNWTQAEKVLKEWNEGIAKLDKEAKEHREVREKASLRADELKEMNERWNKLSYDQKMKIYEESIKESEDKYPIEPLYKKVGTLNKPSDSDSDNCWNS